ncbi:ATP-binding protein [Cereibacter sphaeroides]|uniref:ATP-binding protein n=1 Tax=Cereibacter sphaeroides TaxID=1063 RepID=UPI001F4678B2|nr:ATP-binding protein [Cereibacter sphaeroides]MCE6952495.1 ATP-binding protein [Cereibacter sphaeroides]
MPSDAGRGLGGVTRISIDSEPMAVRAALAQLLDSLILRSLPVEDRDAAEIVLAEVLNNVVEHAYLSGRGEIEVALQLSRGRLTCEITDSGAPMPDQRLPEGGVPEPLPGEPLPEGGFGWSMIRALAKDLEYRRSDGLNRLSFRLGQGCPSAEDAQPAKIRDD